MNEALLVLLESVLGKSRKTSKGNVAFTCPFPDCSSVIKGKQKLEINLNTNEKHENPWHCWVCNNRGKTIRSLFKKLNVSSDELDYIIEPTDYKEYTKQEITLPKEFISFHNLEQKNLNKIANIEYKHALKFLNKRNIDEKDIIKHNIGFCYDGDYSQRIIIPSYDNDYNLNYFIARDYTNNSNQKYKNPPISSKEIICFESHINWNMPIILVEGIFDALTSKENTIPLLGKVIHNKLLAKIITSACPSIYIALDNDARKDALQQAEKLLDFNKKIYLVEMKEKDANEMGYEKFKELLNNTSPLDFSSLIEHKLNLI